MTDRPDALAGMSPFELLSYYGEHRWGCGSKACVRCGFDALHAHHHPDNATVFHPYQGWPCTCGLHEALSQLAAEGVAHLDEPDAP